MNALVKALTDRRCGLVRSIKVALLISNEQLTQFDQKLAELRHFYGIEDILSPYASRLFDEQYDMVRKCHIDMFDLFDNNNVVIGHKFNVTYTNSLRNHMTVYRKYHRVMQDSEWCHLDESQGNQDIQETFVVKYTNGYLECQCKHQLVFHMPCKHILAVYGEHFDSKTRQLIPNIWYFQKSSLETSLIIRNNPVVQEDVLIAEDASKAVDLDVKKVYDPVATRKTLIKYGYELKGFLDRHNVCHLDLERTFSDFMVIMHRRHGNK
eukprot:NODE_266_length_11332_cov_0.554705.p5 type:complete len:266 gc:universal NODE_266_length_11332_cov_0.554705:4330-5127(+)